MGVLEFMSPYALPVSCTSSSWLPCLFHKTCARVPLITISGNIGNSYTLLFEQHASFNVSHNILCKFFQKIERNGCKYLLAALLVLNRQHNIKPNRLKETFHAKTLKTVLQIEYLSDSVHFKVRHFNCSLSISVSIRV